MTSVFEPLSITLMTSTSLGSVSSTVLQEQSDNGSRTSSVLRDVKDINESGYHGISRFILFPSQFVLHLHHNETSLCLLSKRKQSSRRNCASASPNPQPDIDCADCLALQRFQAFSALVRLQMLVEAPLFAKPVQAAPAAKLIGAARRTSP